MASEAQQGELIEWVCSGTGQLARSMLHIITTPHLVKITGQKMLRTLKTKLNKGSWIIPSLFLSQYCL